MKKYGFRFLSVLLFLALSFCSSGCRNQNTSEPEPVQTQEFSYTPGQTQLLIPSADATVTAGGDPLLLDFSHTDQGYFMGLLKQPDTKINIQVIGPDQITYKYFLDTPNVYTTFPFTAGSGPYTILAFENVGGSQYASLFSYSVDVNLENEFLPFLYPNQYVDFTGECEAIELARELSADAATDLDALNLIYKYVTTHITYDNDKAANVQNDYLPDINETLRTGTGICFDYASLTAAMLRSLSIPTRLDIGYSGDIRHAWINVYIESIGWIERAIEFNGKEWKLLDPTFASTASDSKAIMNYIGDGTNYTLLYIR